MIIGRGLLAQAFAPAYAHRKDITIFASGVSDSNEIDPAAFRRERTLLNEEIRNNNSNTCLVYFGTCSVDDSERQHTPYVQHKLEMESLVRKVPRWHVFRLPQVVGKCSNPCTLTNYLYQSVLTGRPIVIWSRARRYLIDIDHVVAVARTIIDRKKQTNHTINIAPEKSYSILEILMSLEQITGQKAIMEISEKGGSYLIEASEAHAVATEIGLDFGQRYIQDVLVKYYGNST